MWEAPLAVVLGGLGRRVAGGAFQQWTGLDVGDFPARAFFGLTLTISLMLGHYEWWCWLIILFTFLGCSIPNFGGIALGRSGNSYRRDALGLTAHGALSMGITALPLAYFHPYGIIYLVLAGCLIVPMYEIGWTLAGVRGRALLPLGLRGGSELGELFWGGTCGVGAYLAGVVA
jgi:hypothetical protein